MWPGLRSPRRHLVGLGVTGAVTGHALMVAALARSRGGAAAVETSGHTYWASCGHAVVGSALVLGASALLAFGVEQCRRARGRRARPMTLRGATWRLVTFQLLAFAMTEVSERVVAHAGWSTLLDHRVLLWGAAIQVVVAVVAAQVLRFVRRAALVIAAHLGGRRARAMVGRWGFGRVAPAPSASHATRAPSRAPPVTV